MEANRENTMEEKVVALIEVKVTPQRGVGYDKIAERIYQHKEVSSVYLMSEHLMRFRLLVWQ